MKRELVIQGFFHLRRIFGIHRSFGVIEETVRKYETRIFNESCNCFVLPVSQLMLHGIEVCPVWLNRDGEQSSDQALTHRLLNYIVVICYFFTIHRLQKCPRLRVILKIS